MRTRNSFVVHTQNGRGKGTYEEILQTICRSRSTIVLVCHAHHGLQQKALVSLARSTAEIRTTSVKLTRVIFDIGRPFSIDHGAYPGGATFLSLRMSAFHPKRSLA